MLNDIEILCLLDTGCKSSLIPTSMIEGLTVEKSGMRLHAANHTEIDVSGEVTVSFKLGTLSLPAHAGI